MTDQAAPSDDSPRKHSGKTAWRIGAWILSAYLAMIVLMMILENSLIFFPTRYPDGDWRPPALEFEDVFFEAADGTRLHGWHVRAEDPRAHVLFSHGNAGNLSYRAPVARLLRDRFNVSVLLYDYRGYGKSEGSPSGDGIMHDARAAQRWLGERAGIDESQVVLMGRSIGAGVSVKLAAENGARGLILESGFTSLADVAAHHYPWLPVRWVMRTQMNALQEIAHYQGPLLQSHGTADEIIPVQFGRRLFEAAPGPKRFIAIEGARHNDPQSEAYYQALDQFFRELPP